jgi:hypothetical protein
MIPLFAVVRVDRLRLWVPLFVVWLLLLPFLLLLLPLMTLACLFLGINPLRACAAFWQTLSGLRGTHIEVNDGESLVLVRIF